MGRSPARSRSAAAGHHQQARAADRPAHPGYQLDRPGLQGPRRCPASQRARRTRFLIRILPKAARASGLFNADF